MMLGRDRVKNKGGGGGGGVFTGARPLFGLHALSAAPCLHQA